MPRLGLITSMESVKDIYRSLLHSSRFHVPLIRMPCLVCGRLIRHSENTSRILLIMCGRTEAKRLVYPKTNKFRRGRSSKVFDLIESDDLLTATYDYMWAKVKQMARYTVLTGSNATQKDVIESNLVSLPDHGRILIANEVCQDIDTNESILDFFTVTTQDAKALVYYDVAKRRAEKQIRKRLIEIDLSSLEDVVVKYAASDDEVR